MEYDVTCKCLSTFDYFLLLCETVPSSRLLEEEYRKYYLEGLLMIFKYHVIRFKLTYARKQLKVFKLEQVYETKFIV